MLEQAFAPHDPRTIHGRKTPEEVAAILGKLKPQFIHHPECRRIIPQIMIEHGVDPECLYFDVPRMRSAYPSHFLLSGIAYVFHPHRDTWYSAPMCQLNWWLPVYPIEPDNALGFYPRYFGEAVKDNSEIYNYYEWNTKGRGDGRAARQERHGGAAEGAARTRAGHRAPPPPPGGIIIFSGAQLHETVPNTTTSRATASILGPCTTMTSWRAARANIDSRCKGTTMRDYLGQAILRTSQTRRSHFTMTVPRKASAYSILATASTRAHADIGRARGPSGLHSPA